MIGRCDFVALTVCVLTSLALAQKPPSFLDAESAGPDFKVQGEYEGTIGVKTKLGAQVVALGEGKFDAVLYFKGLPGAGFEKTKVALKGETKDGVTTFAGTNFKGTIQDGVFRGVGDEACSQHQRCHSRFHTRDAARRCPSAARAASTSSNANVRSPMT